MTINNLDYVLNTTGLTTNVWYGLAINLDNRQRKMSMNLYKRNADFNITMFTNNYESAIVNSNNITGITYYTTRNYKPVKNTEISNKSTNENLLTLFSIEYTNIPLNSFDINKTITVYASDIKLTNIRVFSDVIPNESKNNIIIQRVIDDSNYLILGDNASKKLYTNNRKNTRWE